MVNFPFCGVWATKWWKISILWSIGHKMVRIIGFVEYGLQKNCRRGPHGDLRHNYEIENLLTSFLYGSFLEGLDEQTPEGFCCGDVGALDGGVRAAQGGTEAHDIHVRVLA